MIPKIIHYCWFGGNPLPDLAVKCIESQIDMIEKVITITSQGMERKQFRR